MPQAPSLPHLHSPFLSCPLKLSTSRSSLRVSHKFAGNQRSPKSYPCIIAIDLDQNTVVAISVGFASVAVGIGIPVFSETQIDSAAKRDNTQPCFPCNGTGAQKCRFFTGSGTVTVELGGGEKEVRKKCPTASTAKGSVHLRAQRVRVPGFNLGTLIAESSKTTTDRDLLYFAKMRS